MNNIPDFVLIAVWFLGIGVCAAAKLFFWYWVIKLCINDVADGVADRLKK